MDGAGAKPAKRYYSKGGCRECKRRKIKCDEGKPHCWQCVRLQKHCLYPAAGERVLRVLKRALMERRSPPPKQFKPGPHPLQLPAPPPPPPPVAPVAPSQQPTPAQQAYLSPQLLRSQLSLLLLLLNPQLRHPPPPSPLAFMLPLFLLPTLPSIPPMAPLVARHPPLAPAIPTTSPAPLGALPAVNHTTYQPQAAPATNRAPEPSVPSLGHPLPLGSLKNPAIVNLLNLGPDASVYLLADDLNLLAEDLNKMLTDIVVDGVDPALLPEMLMMQPQPLPLLVPEHNLPLSYIKVTAPHEKLYLEEFYSEFAAIVLPLPAWDAQLRQYYNPARDIILKLSANEPFLMAAVLAEGAKLLFKKNNLKDDDDAYRRYLSKCLSLLGPAMRSLNATLTHNVEAVLVTVLLLTLDTALNAAPDWRPHLRGARDLLLKLARQRVRLTPVLVFCKTWFVAIEVLAGISLRGGGTLANDEIDLLLTPTPYEDEMLRGLGVLRANGFNIFTGAHHDTIPLFRDLTKALAERRRRRTLNKSLEGSWDHMRLFTEFWNQLQVSFVTRQGVCTVQEYQAQAETTAIPEGALVDVLRSQVMVLWMDVSHQLFMLAALITLLTKFFGELHTLPQVQLLTNELTRFLSVLSEPQLHRELIKCLLMMISWPMYVAGLNCHDEQQKYLLMKYFRATAEGGSGTAQHALDRVYSTWKNHKQGIDVDDDDDVDRLDIVSY